MPNGMAIHTLHLLPTPVIKFLSERVEERPSFTFPTRLTVSRCLNPMNIVVSLSSVSFVMVTEAEAAAEPDEPTAPSTTFRRPLRCLTVASRLELAKGVQLMSSFSRLSPAPCSRNRYLCGFFTRVKETLRDLRLRQRSRNDAMDTSESWSWLNLSFRMLGKGVPARAVVSFSKVASVYRASLLDSVAPKFRGREPSFLCRRLSAFRACRSSVRLLRGTRASLRYDSDRVIRGWDNASLSLPLSEFQPCYTR